MDMLKTVLAKIKPTKDEEKQVNDVVRVFLDKLNKNLKYAKAVLGGSGAKNTWLKGSHDVDIFVQYDYNKFRDKNISDLLEKILKKLFKIEKLHGSRDYFQVKYGGFTFEVIPILKISKADKALNITDISPLHAKWVNKFDYADDIRLMKQFCRANEVYGAESYIRGFSGYDCEILVIYYKGFMNLVKNASKWGKKVVIDSEKYYKDDKEVLRDMNVSKKVSPLIIVDPVQKERNVAAALNEEKFELFKIKCKRFLKEKSSDFFEIKEVTIDDLKKKAGKNKLILFEAENIKNKVDIAGSKLLKAFNYIGKYFSLNDFQIVNEGWRWDKKKKALFWFIIEDVVLDDFIKREGPPVKAKKHADNFKKAHKNAFAEKGRLYAKIKREFRKPEEFAKFIINDEYLKDKIKKIIFV